MSLKESEQIGAAPKVGLWEGVMEGREAGFEVSSGCAVLVGFQNLQSEVENLSNSPS